MLAFLSYVTSPILEGFCLFSDVTNGKYPVNADSLGLGVGQFIFALIIFAPIAAGFVIWIVWKYPPQVSFFGYNENRPLWSFVWTLIFGFLIFHSLAESVLSVYENNIARALQNLIIAYLCLLFRAAIVFRKQDNDACTRR